MCLHRRRGTTEGDPPPATGPTTRATSVATPAAPSIASTVALSARSRSALDMTGCPVTLVATPAAAASRGGTLVVQSGWLREAFPTASRASLPRRASAACRRGRSASDIGIRPRQRDDDRKIGDPLTERR